VKPRNKAINALYIIGNSYSATTPQTAPLMWPGMLAIKLRLGFVQARNAAVASAQLFDVEGKPGLITQLRRLPAIPLRPARARQKALLVIWLFPNLVPPLTPDAWPCYTSGIDLAHQIGFRKVFMPNLPDITKTTFYKTHATPAQNAGYRTAYSEFNAQYARMISGFRQRYRDTIYGAIDLWPLWDGTGTIADGFHPNTASHRLFAGWFYDSIVKRRPRRSRAHHIRQSGT